MSLKFAPFSAICVLGVGLAVCVGCGPKKPAGVPNLNPVSVTIVKSGAPVSGANVFFVPDGAASGSWSISAITDASGVATPATFQGDWKEPGVPEGSYKIYVTKLAKIEEPPLPDESDEGAKADYYAERLKRLEAASKEIPEKMKQAETSGLTITVAPGTGANETFDVDQ